MSADARRALRRHQAAARKNAIKAARAQGCTCDVEVVFDQPDHPFAGEAAAGVQRASVRHDDWCPLLRAMEERPGSERTQAVIYGEGTQ